MLTEKNGLIDLHHALVETYSPNRATVALDQFRRFYLALVDGRFGQKALSEYAPPEVWIELHQEFFGALTENGQARCTSADNFFAAARRFLLRIASIAAEVDANGTRPSFFLEKTPHSLLALRFLAELSPDRKFLHVMRDPRSIAYSLRNMSWGPETLAGCCSWVANYCEAWMVTQTEAETHGLPILNVQIEKIAQEHEVWSEKICRSLDIEVTHSLFKGADTDTLNLWAQQCPATEWDEINSHLLELSRSFGYSTQKAGAFAQIPNGYAA